MGSGLNFKLVELIAMMMFRQSMASPYACTKPDAKLQVGLMQYDALVV